MHEPQWVNFYNYLLQNNPQKVESLLNIYHFQYSLPHTLHIPHVLADGSEHTRHMRQKVVAANQIIEYIRKQNWNGIITTDLQRAYLADTEYDLHFQMINVHYLRHWIIFCIKFDLNRGIYLDTKVFDFDRTDECKKAYNQIYEENIEYLLNKLIDWLFPYTYDNGIARESTPSIAETQLETRVEKFEKDELVSDVPKRSRHFSDFP